MSKINTGLTDKGIDRLIYANALLAELYGMIFENKKQEINGNAYSYEEEAFVNIAEKMRSIIKIKENK